jgi:hypothetical protein
MSQDLEVLYSEISAALYKESAIREASFLDITYDICGLPCKQLTPYHYMLLDFCSCPFVKGLTEELSNAEMIKHIVNFLWVVSPDFVTNDSKAKDTFIKEKCSTLDYIQATKEITEYLADMFLDSPPYREKKEKEKQYTPSYYAWVVGYITLIAETFGWRDDYILQLPMPRILQYHNAIYANKRASAGQPIMLINNLSDPVLKKIKDIKLAELQKSKQ